MTTQSAGGAPAKRVKSVTDPAQVTGNVARRVIPVTDGRAADGGAADQVYYVPTADLVENGGRFTVSGEQAIPVINVTSGAVRGGAVMPVYDVTGQAEPLNIAGNGSGGGSDLGDALRAIAAAYWKMD